jgi:hypothetical protein
MVQRHLRAAFALIACVAGLVIASWAGCSSSDGSGANANGDGGEDGGGRRPGSSSGDEGNAAGRADAPAPFDPNALENPFQGQWDPIPNTPAFCKFFRAADPRALRSKWLPCASNRVGCRVLDTSWVKPRPGRRITHRSTEPGRIIGTTAYIRTRRIWPPPFVQMGPWYAYVDILEAVDGDPVIAIGAGPTWINNTPRTCHIQLVTGDYGVGFAAYPYDPNSPPQDASLIEAQTPHLLAWSPWSPAVGSVAPTFATTKSVFGKDLGDPLVTNSIFLIHTAMNPNGLWFNTISPTTALFFNAADAKPTFAFQRTIMDQPLPIPGGAITLDASGAVATIAHVSETTGAITRIVTPGSPHRVSFAMIDRSTTPFTLLWVESDFGNINYTNSVLWSSPLPSSEAGLVRRRIAKLADVEERGGAYAVANRGVVLSLIARDKALVTRQSDGLGWLITAEPNTRFTMPVWVDDKDVYIETSEVSPSGIDDDPNGMLRIARDSGPPTVASGF